MKKSIYLLCFLFSCFYSISQDKTDIDPDRIVIKFKPGFSPKSNSKLAKTNDPISGQYQKLSYQEKSTSVLDGLYYYNLPKGQDIYQKLDSINQLPYVEYAEPLYRESLLEVPNDPEAKSGGSQYYLSLIDAYRAWDVTKSNSDIVIGIIDTGTDLEHEDIKGNLFTNDNDPVNGIDDDNNGYIDDYQGYDFADNDPVAQADGNGHGTHVSGVALAETNNETGIASVGYRARHSPLKVFDSELTQSNGNYEAILYAADNGYDIVNLSWGAPHNPSRFQQDIINYAVLEKNVVVVAAAGNTPNDLAFYPASYDNVLSVASTNGLDEKAGFSTYNENVDLTAPGAAIYSTQNGNTYGSDNGTSHSAPMVAGVAALVIDQFPDLNARQVMERIKATTDDIYNISTNQQFDAKLGTGRLNAYNAVTREKVYSLIFKNKEITGSSGSTFYPGDTIYFTCEVENVLDPILGLSITAESTSPYLTILEGGTDLGLMITNETQRVDTIKAVLSKNTPALSKPEIILAATNPGTLSLTNVTSFTTAPSYLYVDNEEIIISNQSSGINGRSSDQTGTRDFSWLNRDITLQQGLILSYDEKIIDNLPDTWKNTDRTNEFNSYTEIRPYRSSLFQEGSVANFISNDSVFSIQQKSVILNDSIHSILFIQELVNNQTDTLFDVIVGQYIDPDLTTLAANYGNLTDHNTFIAQYLDQEFVGHRLLSGDSISFAAFDQGLADSVTNTITNEILNDLLFRASTDSIGYQDAIDIGLIGRIKIDTILPGGVTNFGLILGGTGSRDELIAEIELLDSIYSSIQSDREITRTYYSCEGGNITVEFENADSIIYFSDPNGKDILGYGPEITFGPIEDDSIFYYRNYSTKVLEPVQALQVLLLNNIADFEIDPDTLLISSGEVNKVTFTDKSLDPVSRIWDFGNGTQASGITTPTVTYNEIGNFPVTLMVENATGCLDTIQKTLVVLEKPAKPSIGTQLVCPDSPWILETGDRLNVYATNQKNSFISSSDRIVIDKITTDTTFYISRLENNLESDLIPVKVSIDQPDSKTKLAYDLSSTSANAVSLFMTESSNNISEWKYINEVLVTSDTLKFDAVPGPFPYEVLFESKNGCSFSVSDTIYFEEARQTMLDTMQYICSSGSLNIGKPGEFYAFYADNDELQLIDKASSITLENVQDSNRIYVRNISNYTAGPLLSIDILEESIDLLIEANPDSLILSEGFSATFEVSPEMSQTIWYLNEVFQTIDFTPTFFFDSVGTYRVHVRAESITGCEYTNTLNYVVTESVPLSTSSSNEIEVYPNPSYGTLFLKGNLPTEVNLEVFDLTGKSVRFEKISQDNIVKLNLADGTYLLEITNRDGNLLKKQVIKIRNQ